MPHITKVNISSQPIAVGSPQPNRFPVRVSATIEFSDLEQRLGLSYQTRFVLYEIDETMDVYTVFPNSHELFLQRASRGDKDDFIGFSENESIKADAASKTIEHKFDVRTSIEPDLKMELKALAICIPETATAMKWSETRNVEIING